MTIVRITGTGAQLQGVGRLEDGRVVFVPGALQGETVSVEITKAAARYCEAALCAVLEPSEDRVTPDCPYSGACGGCSGRHMCYQATLAVKQKGVRDALERIGGLVNPEVRPILGCAEPNGTRNKVEFAVGRRSGQPVVGMMASGSRDVIAISECRQAQPPIDEALKWAAGSIGTMPNAAHIRNLVCRSNRAGELMLIFCADAPIQADVARMLPQLRRTLPALTSVHFVRQKNRPAQPLDGTCEKLFGADTLRETLLGLRFDISPQSFFQVNAAQAERLYAAAIEAAGSCESVLDAYCGAGTISLCASRVARRVTGVEIYAPAVEDAKRNARLNGLEERARFICADAARELPARAGRGERFDVVLLDPPRKGVDEKALQAVMRAAPKRVVYVSCDPATLARDVKILTAGGYEFRYAQPVDMFPYTGHVETVVLMSRNM